MHEKRETGVDRKGGYADTNQSARPSSEVCYQGLPLATIDARIEFLPKDFVGSFCGWTIPTSATELAEKDRSVTEGLRRFANERGIAACEFHAYHVLQISDGSIVRAKSLRIVDNVIEPGDRRGRPPEEFNAYEIEFHANVAPPPPNEGALNMLVSDVSGGRRTGIFLTNCEHEMACALADFLVQQVESGKAVGAAMDAMIIRAREINPKVEIDVNFGYAENYVLGGSFNDCRKLFGENK